MKIEPQLPYSKPINRVIAHIYAELSNPNPKGLNLEHLSEVACYSKYHFHRLFQAQVGCNVQRFVSLLRLKKSAYQLAFYPEISIIDIALDAHFESHEAFSRAFKKHYKLTPSQFRKTPAWPESMNFKLKTNKEDMKMIETTVCEFPETAIAVLEHHGSPDALNHTVASFIEWRKASDVAPITQTQTFGLVYCDPASVPAEEFRFDVCCSTLKPVGDNPQGVINKTIPSCRCVRITHHGPYELMDDKIRYLYSQWLVENNEEPMDFPCFFHYKNLFPEVAEHDLVTDIYLPLK
ncbi:MAG: AraC family transcriptional regulator [Xanthomonadales bacterium]|nr:AraC family transcriptional regulator [Xanthomonadales bacterium]